MRFSRFQLAILSIVFCLLWLPERGLAQRGGVRKRKKAAVPVEQSIQELKDPSKAPPEKPAVPPKPEEMPATPPAVTFENGQLTITAKNSTLSDILDAVKTETGAAIDVPPGADERVVGQIGPGPARDVLASLLNGSRFNYVMVGSETDSTAVNRVILTAKTPGAETPPGQMVAQQPRVLQPAFGNRSFRVQQMPQPQVQVPAGPGDSDATEQDETSQDADDEEMQDQNANTADQQPNANPAQPGVKTPEQLLMELQRQQLLIQQQQQQTGQPQPGQPQGVNPPPQEEKPPR
ncbi:MAG TPA: hypothetical protein VGF08_12390 [Terriglobales bacterium]|jgi:hypothetical protein